MRRHRIAAALATGAALLAGTACSSSIAGTATTAGAAAAATSVAKDFATGKPESLSPDQVVSAITTAYQGASAVHVKGSTASGGSTMKIDLQLNKDSGSGTLEGEGMTMPVNWANGVFYLQFTDILITKMGQSPTTGPGAALRNKWVSSNSPIGSSMASAVKDFLNYNAFLQKLVDEFRRKAFTAAGSETVNGVAVFAFKSADGTILDVAASTPHYLMRVVEPQTGSELNLTGWNHPVAVTPPPASEIYSGPGA
jgi:hypothetical protein